MRCPLLASLLLLASPASAFVLADGRPDESLRLEQQGTQLAVAGRVTQAVWTGGMYATYRVGRGRHVIWDISHRRLWLWNRRTCRLTDVGPGVLTGHEDVGRFWVRDGAVGAFDEERDGLVTLRAFRPDVRPRAVGVRAGAVVLEADSSLFTVDARALRPLAELPYGMEAASYDAVRGDRVLLIHRSLAVAVFHLGTRLVRAVGTARVCYGIYTNANAPTVDVAWSRSSTPSPIVNLVDERTERFTESTCPPDPGAYGALRWRLHGDSP